MRTVWLSPECRLGRRGWKVARRTNTKSFCSEQRIGKHLCVSSDQMSSAEHLNRRVRRSLRCSIPAAVRTQAEQSNSACSRTSRMRLKHERSPQFSEIPLQALTIDPERILALHTVGIFGNSV